MIEAIFFLIYVAAVGIITYVIAAIVKYDVGADKLTLYVWAVCFSAAGSVTMSLWRAIKMMIG